MKRDTYCSYCGTAFASAENYPRTCSACQTITWANPIPVSVALVPVAHRGRTGILVIRRGIEPGKGKLALVGGFLEEHETWAEGGVREVQEETGVEIPARSLTPFWYASTEPKPNRVLLFSVASAIESTSLGSFITDGETLERGLVFGPEGLRETFAFPLHVAALERYFDQHSITGPHGFTAV